VHLYSRYLSPTQVNAVTSKLNELGFKVETNTLAFPDTVKQSTLVYSPFIESEQRLNSLIGDVEKLGWTLSRPQILMEGNHWYTKNNVGLFLLPEGARKKDSIAAQDLAHEYQTRQCAFTASIKLNRDSSYELSFSTSFKKLINTRADFIKGQWKITAYPYLELKSINNEWLFYFKINTKKIVDNIGKVNIIELIPEDNYTALPKCNYAYGIRG